MTADSARDVRVPGFAFYPFFKYSIGAKTAVRRIIF